MRTLRLPGGAGVPGRNNLRGYRTAARQIRRQFPVLLLLFAGLVIFRHTCSDFNSYRAARVKSLINAESGCNFNLDADLPIENTGWKLGVIVGPSGSGKTSPGSSATPQTRSSSMSSPPLSTAKLPASARWPLPNRGAAPPGAAYCSPAITISSTGWNPTGSLIPRRGSFPGGAFDGAPPSLSKFTRRTAPGGPPLKSITI